jgi:hypothetical protein
MRSPSMWYVLSTNLLIGRSPPSSDLAMYEILSRQWTTTMSSSAIDCNASSAAVTMFWTADTFGLQPLTAQVMTSYLLAASVSASRIKSWVIASVVKCCGCGSAMIRFSLIRIWHGFRQCTEIFSFSVSPSQRVYHGQCQHLAHCSSESQALGSLFGQFFPQFRE